MPSIETIARALGLRRTGARFSGKCPGCGYKTGFTLAEKKGNILIYCHAGGCTQAELWRALANVGLAPQNPRDESCSSKKVERTPRVAAITATRQPSDSSAAQALAIWRRSSPAPGTVVETYLRDARGYTGPIPPVLRFARGPHPSDPKRWHPMMVAAVVLDGRIIGVHRTFLRLDGCGKADLEPNKMTLGPCRGGAAPLMAAGPRLAIGEGIETALSYMQSTGIPTWSALSAAGIRNLVVPNVVREEIIALDPDPVGIMAGYAAARVCFSEGRRVSIARPPLGLDFNDLARAR